MSKARASAMRPLVIPVLFTTCVALLAGNSVVLLLNLQTLPSSESNVDHVRPGTHTELLRYYSLVKAATARSEYSPTRLLADTVPAPVRADRSSDRNFGDETVAAYLLELDKPASYVRFRSTALVGTIVNAAAIAMLVLFYLLIRRSFARQSKVDTALKSHNRDLEDVVAQRTRELSELSGHLIRVAEREKARLARDLHDELGASLTAMKLDMAYVAARLKDSAPRLAARLQRAIDTLRCTFHLKQRLVEDLWPTMLDHLGLSAAVLAYCTEFTFRTGVPCFSDIAEDLDMDPDRSIAMYRVVQESLTNIAKHAQASNVVVFLKRERGGVALRIHDDGIGISAGAASKVRSYGVVGMRERISLLGGKFAISRRTEAGGTLVEAFIPERSNALEPAVLDTRRGCYAHSNGK
jgi:signal transduction histidine kinase